MGLDGTRWVGWKRSGGSRYNAKWRERCDVAGSSSKRPLGQCQGSQVVTLYPRDHGPTPPLAGPHVLWHVIALPGGPAAGKRLLAEPPSPAPWNPFEGTLAFRRTGALCAENNTHVRASGPEYTLEGSGDHHNRLVPKGGHHPKKKPLYLSGSHLPPHPPPPLQRGPQATASRLVRRGLPVPDACTPGIAGRTGGCLRPAAFPSAAAALGADRPCGSMNRPLKPFRG